MSIYATATPDPVILSGEWSCRECGFRLFSGKPNPERLCESCRARDIEPGPKAIQRSYREITSGRPDIKTRCRAWLGDFDDADNPIHPDGSFVRPGKRLCGHRDCVAVTHIVAEGDSRAA